MGMAFALFAGSAMTAQASHFDSMYKTSNANWDCWDGTASNGLYCRTDNGYLTFAIEPGMTTAGDNDVREVLRDQFGPTDLERHEQTGSDVEYSGSTETDIIYDWADPALPAGTFGITWCNDASSSTECDQEYISFDNMGGSEANPWKGVVCHETGHAVGLTHGHEAAPRQSQTDGDLGCMRTEGTVDQIISWTALGSHNATQINATYAAP
ncbi:hypothetical protein AB0M28_10380 [Streptomyces sp. NPDC051940]|uniref:hypothetical protein n=1 Tax=Streptomyces sp. NPDC051940 TaxID=3155675 RepID=UPI0034297957